MPNHRFKTYLKPARVTDRDAVQNLINEYRFPIDVEVFIVPGTDRIRIDADGTFLEAYSTGSDEPSEHGMDIPHTLALGEFFTRLAEFIVQDDELLIQLVGIPPIDEPLLAVEWCISSDGVSETTFTLGESSSWTSLPRSDSTE